MKRSKDQHHSDKRDKFDEAWKNAFENAEHQTSFDGWQAIENSLNKASVDKFKRKVAFWKSIAAAVIIVSVSTLSLQYIFNRSSSVEVAQIEKNSDSSIIAENDNQQNDIVSSPAKGIIEAPSFSSPKNKSARSIWRKKGLTPSTLKRAKAFNKTKMNKEEMVAQEELAPSFFEETNTFENKTLVDNTEVAFPFIESTSLTFLGMDKKNMEEDFQSYKRNKAQEAWSQYEAYASNGKAEESGPKKFYASFSVGTNTMDPSYEISQFDQNQANKTVFTALNEYNEVSGNPDANPITPDEERGISPVELMQDSKPVPTIAFSAKIGKPFGKKWATSTGIYYSQYNSTTRANIAAIDASSRTLVPVGVWNVEGLNNGDLYAPVKGNYQIEQNFKLLSIPLEVAYSIIGNDLTFSLKTGLTADVLMDTEWNEKDAQIDRSSVQADYNDMYISGLFGSELNYQFTPRYSIGLAANYKFAVTSMTAQAQASNYPVSYGVLTSFKYHFGN